METKVCKNCHRELPIEMFKNTRWGTRAHVCNDCANEKKKRTYNEKALKRVSDIEKARNERIASFTARELMTELKSRGYTFTMNYEEQVVQTVTHVISSDDL